MVEVDTPSKDPEPCQPCLSCSTKSDQLLERDKVIRKLRESLERERNARAQAEAKYKNVAEKNVGAEKLAAEANGKAVAAEKRVQDLEKKLEATVKACRSDRRKAMEELEVIQERCNQSLEEMKVDTAKQLEYAKKEYEDNIESIRKEAEDRVKEIEENAINDARGTALDHVQEAQAESAKAEAEVQDLRKELEKVTTERSEVVDQLRQINKKNEREKYVLHEKIEFMEQQYQERMTQQESVTRTEMQALHERQIKQVFKELEWEKQKLNFYKKNAENELQDNTELLLEIESIHERCAVEQEEIFNSMSEFKKEILERQQQVEFEMRVLLREEISFLSSLLRPASPDEDALVKANVVQLQKKVQKLKASFSYLKYRSLMGTEVKKQPASPDENTESSFETPMTGEQEVEDAPRTPGTPRNGLMKTSATTPGEGASTKGSNHGAYTNSPYLKASQKKETFVVSDARRSQSARPSRYNVADISTLKPSSASFTPNFSDLKPLKSVKNVNMGMLGGLQRGKADFFNLKDFKTLERKKSGRSTLGF
ncbi:hypothetical protein HOP50_12g65780 [Chloropicon primus]|uniref:Uncharacterized protein n=1 Tax=Chloropicon primus TaxID=1764295 RepID=A0A5B8MTD7_9CHLO|nr:hypothetical protein A3770_12p65560 [Chloropicon primus]UPR03250.1 hypothetical protein HOP50_12g65780 [Chloropicon primus]|eukprot:QDZ24038.1 hypothetical protein A3770_12p65560 [Chloropicon primus]